MNRATIVAVMLGVVSAPLLADPAFTPASVPENLHVYDAAGSAYVDLVPHGCSGKRYRIDPDHASYDTLLSMLMTAQVTGTEVVIRYGGCNAVPQGRVIGVYLK